MYKANGIRPRPKKKSVWFRFPTDPVNLCATQIILWAWGRKNNNNKKYINNFFDANYNYVFVQHLFILYKDVRILSFLTENNGFTWDLHADNSVALVIWLREKDGYMRCLHCLPMQQRDKQNCKIGYEIFQKCPWRSQAVHLIICVSSRQSGPSWQMDWHRQRGDVDLA